MTDNPIEWLSGPTVTAGRDLDIHAACLHQAKKLDEHTDAEQVLAKDNLERTAVLIATDRQIQGWLFWVPQGQTRGGSGFSYGPGFKAYASDFPEGTRLVVTARIELPAAVDAGRVPETGDGGHG